MKLVLFFTNTISLKIWDKAGILDREIALYKRLRDKGVSTTFITYGNEFDLNYRYRLKGIKILCNRWNIRYDIYQRMIHLIHAKSLYNCDLIKTNQMNGAEVALRTAQFWKKPFIARCGWMWSFNNSKEKGINSFEAKNSRAIEKMVFGNADCSVVTTKVMREDLISRIPKTKKKVRIIPNYVDVLQFSPTDNFEKLFDVIFVGRLSNEKNIESFLEATNIDNHKILIIGQGPLKELVVESKNSLKSQIKLIDRVPNNKLPYFYNAARIFVISSFYENHPKTLIEAMSCGMAVIGSDSPGIREIIQHEITGYLCGTDSESLGFSINKLLNDEDKCYMLGKNARQFVIDNYSLDNISNIEYDLYTEVLNKKIKKKKYFNKLNTS